MVSDPSFELVTIFSMTLIVQYFSYVKHIGTSQSTFLCSHHAPTTYKKNYYVELISFLIQICCQGQHLELLGY